MKNQFLLCPYDGFKLRIYAQSYIDYMLLHSKKYNLVGRKLLYQSDDEIDISPYPIVGEYEGFSIQIVRTRKGPAVEIAGSFHKYFYGHENYQPFYWNDFMDVYNRFIKFFAIDPYMVSVVNLEVGINVKTHPSWLATARKICSNILFFNPPSNRSAKDIKEYKKFGFSWCTFHDDHWIKIYDKLPKFKQKEDDIIRLEKKHIKSKPLKKLGAHCLSDLLRQEVVLALNDNLIKTLKKLVIYQCELDHCESLTEEDKTFLLQYKKPEAWDAAYKDDKKRKLFKAVKKKYDKLVNRYTSFNLKEELLTEAAKLLYQEE